jgi:aspartyl-tRNA(Asn)/glutamyl-tRNA(Gln) amidotransferase subunit C
MRMSREEVLRLAQLGRLHLEDAEIATLQDELGSILGYVDRLSKVDVEGVEPFAMPALDVWRADVPMPAAAEVRERILSQFPKRRGDLLQTPGVFEKPKG